MSIRPSSRPASCIIDFTLASSVMSQRRAKARTPRLERSITVCCASRAELRKVMATSAPACARARAEARPRRRAAPVIRHALPRKGLHSPLSTFGFYSPTGNRSSSRCSNVLFSCQMALFQRYNPRVQESRQVVVYSRKGCHLCEVVKESLSKLSRRGGFTWREVDVDSDTELRRQFNDEVPVVFIDGRKAFKYRMDEREFLRKLVS